MATKTATPQFTYRASHEYAKTSVRKLLPILDLIRGKYADDAVDVLKFLPHRGARMIEKVLKSAMANAEDRGVRNVGDLVISDCRGEGGPMFKRLMPRARGMAYMIRRRSAHIRIALTDYDALDAAAAKLVDEAARD
jgi:large subunit ribosomal protein L22